MAERETPPPSRGSASARGVVVGAGSHHRHHDRRVIVVTLSQLHPSLLLHATRRPPVATRARTSRCPSTSRSLLSHGHLTRLGPGLVRRLPPLHLLLHASRPLHRHRRLDHPLRRRVQARARSSGRSAARSAPGPAAASSGFAHRSRPCWPPPRCRSSSTTRSPSTAATCSRRWPGSTRTPSACRWRSCSSGSSPAPSGRAGTAAGPRSSSPAASSRTSSRGMYALGGAVILTVVELLPARWGIGDSALACSGADDAGAVAGPVDTHVVVGRLDRRHRPAALGVGGWCPSGSSTPTRRPWATRTSRAGPSTSARPTPGPSSSPGSASSRPCCCGAASASP